MRDRDALDAVREAAEWFPGRSDGVAERPSDILPALLYLIGDARLVLIGEATSLLSWWNSGMPRPSTEPGWIRRGR
jgi:hypothetical protein